MTAKKGKLHLQKMVYKGNPLIEGAYSMSNREQRLVALLSSQVEDRHDQALHTYVFTVAELSSFLGLEGDNRRYEKIRGDLYALMSRVVSIQEEGNTELLAHFVSKARLNPDTGKIELQVHEELQPYYLDLKNRYTRYQLGQVMSFRGTYTLRFFEWFKQQEFTKTKAGWWYVNFEISDLRRRLDLEPRKGQPKPKFPRWPDLRRFVIEPVVQEIEEQTDWNVNWETVKWGRAVGEIKFHIGSKKTRVTAKGASSPAPAAASKKKHGPDPEQPDLGFEPSNQPTSYAREELLPRLQKASEEVQNYYKALQGKRIQKAQKNDEEISEEEALLLVLQDEPGVLFAGGVEK